MPTVKDIMTKDVVSIGVNNSVFEAAELMSSNLVGCLVIMDGEVPIGIVTERDIVQKGRGEKIAAGYQGLGDYV